MNERQCRMLAEDFINEANPGLWDGKGMKPKRFHTITYEYPIDEKTRFELVYAYNDCDFAWKCYCSVVQDETCVSDIGTFEINSVDAVTVLIHEAYCRYQEGQYFRAVGDAKTNYPASKCKIIRHNEGLVFVC